MNQVVHDRVAWTIFMVGHEMAQRGRHISKHTITHKFESVGFIIDILRMGSEQNDPDGC